MPDLLLWLNDRHKSGTGQKRGWADIVGEVIFVGNDTSLVGQFTQEGGVGQGRWSADKIEDIRILEVKTTRMIKRPA